MKVGCQHMRNIIAIGLILLPLHVPLAAKASEEAIIWQGLDHQWQRMALGLFQTPHRISTLSSLIEADQSSITLGQSPGVDGDYMIPRAYLEKVRATGVNFQYQVIELEFSDQNPSHRPDTVLSEQQQIAQFQLHPDYGQQLSAVLGGISIESKCLPIKGHSCNSDGFWPYQLSFEILPCQKGQEGKAQCPVQLKLGRSWTPNQGGVPYIDNKPFNFSMQFKIKVGDLLAQSSPQFMRARTFFWNESLKNDRQQADGLGVKLLDMSGQDFSKISFGLHKMAFQFDGRHNNRPGRYLSGLGFFGERTQEGLEFKVNVKIPKTVNKTPLHWQLGVTLWDFDQNPDVEIIPQPYLEVPICMESRNAPFYSQWHRCKKLGHPVNRETITLPLNI